MVLEKTASAAREYRREARKARGRPVRRRLESRCRRGFDALLFFPLEGKGKGKDGKAQGGEKPQSRHMVSASAPKTFQCRQDESIRRFRHHWDSASAQLSRRGGVPERPSMLPRLRRGRNLTGAGRPSSRSLPFCAAL